MFWFYYEPAQGCYLVKEYNGEVKHAHGVGDYEAVFIYNNCVLTNRNQLHDTLRGAVLACNGNGRFRTPILYNGENINTLKDDIFVCVDSCGRLYRNSYFDDSILRKFEG